LCPLFHLAKTRKVSRPAEVQNMVGYTGRLGGRAGWDGGRYRSGRGRQQMLYWPLARPFLLAGLVAVAPHPAAVAGLAYAGGTLGTLLGADLVNLPKVRRLGAPVVSIGGAGTFDGVFITGIVAVLLASLL
jgi:Protein of unknown function (DUF1614)